MCSFDRKWTSNPSITSLGDGCWTMARPTRGEPAIDRLSLATKKLLSNLYGTLLKLGLLHINLQS